MGDLPFHSATQIVALLLTLIAGWCFGLASAPRRRMRERVVVDEDERPLARTRADLDDARARIRDLEAENARLRAGGPIPSPDAERREP